MSLTADAGVCFPRSLLVSRKDAHSAIGVI